jgi:hypothetical protein
MDYNKNIKEELDNRDLIENSRLEFLKIIKKLKEQKKPFCELCVKQDFELGEYDEDDTSKYFELTLNEELSRTVKKENKIGQIVNQPHTHYDCLRGHGVVLCEPHWIEAPLMRNPYEYSNTNENPNFKKEGSPYKKKGDEN